MAKKPNIRFAGFEDDWEQRKLGEVAEIIGGGTPSTSNDEYWDGEIDWYAPAEIGERIYLESSQRKITEEGLNKSSAKILPIGTVLFTSRAGIGKTAILLKEGCTNQGFQSIVPNKEKLDSYFIFTRSEELKRYGETVGAGSTFVEVSGKQMANMELMMPKTMLEQQQIGKYFSTLDHLITLHQRKCDELKKVKKFMLQKMFPKKGEKNPEIRFDGFTNDWEQRKFSELYAKSSEKNDGSIGMDRNITVATMQFKEDVKVSTAEYLKTYYTFNLGDIAFEGHQSKEFRYGRFVENDIGNGIVSHIFAVFRPIKEFDLQFWKYAINNEMLMQRILSRSTKASTMMHDLVTEDFLNEIFLVPSLNEQKQIGTYLKSIDHLITLHQRKCEELKNVKKYMLQNMFAKGE